MITLNGDKILGKIYNYQALRLVEKYLDFRIYDSSFAFHYQHSFFYLRIKCCVDQLNPPYEPRNFLTDAIVSLTVTELSLLD